MKTEVQKEKAEAELLAQNGFNITIGKRKFTIKPLTFGAIVKANQYATEIKMNIKGGEISSMVQNYQENTDPLMKFIAVAILGTSKLKVVSPSPLPIASRLPFSSVSIQSMVSSVDSIVTVPFRVSSCSVRAVPIPPSDALLPDKILSTPKS